MITNQVTLVGYVETVPEYKRTKNYESFIIFSLKTLESFKNKEGKLHTKTSWHRVSIWGDNTVPVIFKNIHKGDNVRLEGKLKNKQWVDKDGIKRTGYEIAINDDFGSCLLIPPTQEDEVEALEKELANFFEELGDTYHNIYAYNDTNDFPVWGYYSEEY